MSESGKVVVTKAKLDELANRINEKAGSTGPKTIAELTQTVANIPSALVTSVNGAIGEVKSTFYVTVTQQGDTDTATADKTAEEVYAAYEAGYAVYAIVNGYTRYPTILPMIIGFTSPDIGLLLVFVTLTGPKSFMALQYDGVAWSVSTFPLLSLDEIVIPEYLPNPNALNIKIGDTTTSYDGSAAKTVEIPERVPSVTTADNGKFLRVANGAWAAVEIANANGVSF